MSRFELTKYTRINSRLAQQPSGKRGTDGISQSRSKAPTSGVMSWRQDLEAEPAIVEARSCGPGQRRCPQSRLKSPKRRRLLVRLGRRRAKRRDEQRTPEVLV